MMQQVEVEEKHESNMKAVAAAARRAQQPGRKGRSAVITQDEIKKGLGDDLLG